MRKERNLLQTLATTVAFFCICWLPYGFAILIDIDNNIDPLLKKVFFFSEISESTSRFSNQLFIERTIASLHRNLMARIISKLHIIAQW